MATTESDYEMDGERNDDGATQAADAAAVEGSGSAWGNLLTGAVIGLAVGGVLAILFAPKPGSELRLDIVGAVDDLRGRAEQVLDSLQETTSDLIAQSKATLDQTRENLVRSVEVGREAYEQKRDELASRLEPASAEPLI